MKLLSEEQIEAVDRTALRILDEVGVRILDESVRDRLAASGVPVEEDGRVRLEGSWLEARLREAPSRFTLFSRDGQHDVAVGSGRCHFGNGGRVFQILDMATRGFRPTLLRDVARTAALVDRLEFIRFYIIACQAHDLPPAHYHRNDFYQAFAHTAKHVMGGVDSLEGVRQMHALAAHIAGGEDTLRDKPFASVITNPISPLTLDGESLRILEFCGRKGIPATCAPAPIAGATAPATLAGTLAQLHAEALAGVALAQFLVPGAPVFYGAVASTMDLRTMNLAIGSVETAMINTCSVDLAHRYGLPIYASAGVTDAKLPDIQAGFEKGVSNLMLGMAGADFIHLAAGMLDSGNSIALEQYVIDNEILGMTERILRGVRVSDRALALEAVARVGPGGNYVTDEHTVENMFEEFFYPTLAVREQYDRWTELGSPTPLTKARDWVEDTLRRSELRLDAALVKELRSRFPEIVDP